MRSVRVAGFIVMCIELLSEGVLGSDTKYNCTECCRPSGTVTGTSDGLPTNVGYTKEYIKCLKLPNATTAVNLTFTVLNLGDKISLLGDCSNHGEAKTVNHLRIGNRGDGDVFTCSDIQISKPANIPPQGIASPDNNLVFNLTAGRPPAGGDPWYDVHYTLTYCPDIDGGVISRQSQFNFNITCLEGREGVDGSDVYTCKQGVWNLGGRPTTPICAGGEGSAPVTENPSTDKQCKYEHELIWRKLDELEKGQIEQGEKLDDVIVAVIVVGVVVFVAIAIVAALVISNRKKINRNQKNLSLIITELDKLFNRLSDLEKWRDQRTNTAADSSIATAGALRDGHPCNPTHPEDGSELDTIRRELNLIKDQLAKANVKISRLESKVKKDDMEMKSLLAKEEEDKDVIREMKAEIQQLTDIVKEEQMKTGTTSGGATRVTDGPGSQPSPENRH